MPIKLLLLLLATIIFPAVAFSQMAAPHGPCHHFPTDFPWVVNLNGCDCYSIVGRACNEPPILYNEAFCYNETVGEEGRFYCAGGTIRQCDKELTTQTEGPDGPYASECQGGEYCSENGRCDSCKTKKSCNDNKVETTDTCIEGSLYEKKQTCGHCEVIKGRSGAVKKITFVAGVGSNEVEVRELLQIVGEVEPFQTLIKWGNLNFQIANGSQGYTILPFDFDVSLIEQSSDFYKSINKFGNAACENSELIVYVLGTSLASIDTKALGGYWVQHDLVISAASSVVLVHELGHALGDLADEYPLDKAMQKKGPNVIDGIEGRFCPPFDKLVDPQNCFYIDKENDPGRRMSRCSSTMGAGLDEIRFNIISCAGIMNGVAGMSTENGVEFCKGLAQNGKVLAQDCP